jgi:hypothetical protein
MRELVLKMSMSLDGFVRGPKPIFSKVRAPLRLKLQYEKSFDSGVVAHVYRTA